MVDKLISQLAKPGTPVIQCYNKRDLVPPEEIPVGENVVSVSAATGEGLEGLLAMVERELDRGRHHVCLLLPYAMGGLVEALHDGAKVLSVEYDAQGIVVEAICDEILYGRVKQYEMKEKEG